MVAGVVDGSAQVPRMWGEYKPRDVVYVFKPRGSVGWANEERVGHMYCRLASPKRVIAEGAGWWGLAGIYAAGNRVRKDGFPTDTALAALLYHFDQQ